MVDGYSGKDDMRRNVPVVPIQFSSLAIAPSSCRIFPFGDCDCRARSSRTPMWWPAICVPADRARLPMQRHCAMHAWRTYGATSGSTRDGCALPSRSALCPAHRPRRRRRLSGCHTSVTAPVRRLPSLLFLLPAMLQSAVHRRALRQARHSRAAESSVEFR